jgi:molybdopterin biosynthesis enzyme
MLDREGEIIVARLTEQVTAAEMGTAAQTGVVAVLVVQCVTVKVLGAGKGLSAAWMAAAKLFLDAIGGGFGAGGRDRRD